MVLLGGCQSVGGKTYGGGKGNITHKDANGISIGWDEAFFNVDFGRQIAANHCRKHGKYAFYFYDNNAGVDGAGLWFCSRTYLARSSVSGHTYGWNNYRKISLPTVTKTTEPEPNITATDTTPPIIEIAEVLSWKCTGNEHIKYVNLQLDFEKKTLTSQWVRKKDNKYDDEEARVLHVDDEKVIVQDYIKELSKYSETTWEFYYASDLRTVHKGIVTYYGDCKIISGTVKKPKPEITATDTTPPVIEIAEQITVNDPEYVLEGRVTDKDTSKVPYLTVNKSPIKVTPDGRFKISRFSVDDEELTLVAIDEFNNKTTKIVKVKVDVKEVVVAKTYDQLQPSMVKGIKNNNRIAIIIGVEKYAYTPVEALYANRDAKVFKVYANKGLGIASSNIKLLVDNEANRINTIAALKTWLPNKIIPDQSELFIFFAGHGLASDDGKELYLIPQDGNIRLLAESALSQKYIIEQIQKLKPKSVTMFFDSCYSGQARDDRILVAGLRPIIIKAEEQEVPANFNIFSASNFDQTSGSINEVQHGIFSYWLMKAMEGKADDNQDKQITNGELIAYLKTNVSKEAFNQNREQDPMLVGDANQVLMKYR